MEEFLKGRQVENLVTHWLGAVDGILQCIDQSVLYTCYDGTTYLLGHLGRLAFLYIHEIFSLLFKKPTLPEATVDEQQSGIRTVAGAISKIGRRSQRGQYPAPVKLGARIVELGGLLGDLAAGCRN